MENKLLRRFMFNNSLTQSDVARACKLNQSYISYILAGKKTASDDVVNRFATAYRLDYAAANVMLRGEDMAKNCGDYVATVGELLCKK